MSRFGIIRLLSGAFSLSLKVATLTADRAITFPATAPVTGQVLSASNANGDLTWTTPSVNPGTVTSVGLTGNAMFSITNTPITSNGNINIDFTSQSAGLVLASPAGAAGTPLFRALAATDIPSLDAAKITTGTVAYARLPVGTTANTVAAGNDGRFHTQNTDTGTTSATFQLATGSSGNKIKNNGTAIELRNAADTGYVDLTCNNLYVRGTTVTVDSETVLMADNTIQLNSNYTGSAPTENGGIEVVRGTLANADVLWNESTKRWMAGLVGSEVNIALQKQVTFNSTNVVSGSVTITHNLNNTRPDFTVWDDTNQTVAVAATATSANVLTLDVTGLTIGTPSWTVVVTG